MNTTLTDEQATNLQAQFAFWRFHLWSLDYGSYNEIEDKMAAGELPVFVCPKHDCDCRWPKEAVSNDH